MLAVSPKPPVATQIASGLSSRNFVPAAILSYNIKLGLVPLTCAPSIIAEAFVLGGILANTAIKMLVIKA